MHDRGTIINSITTFDNKEKQLCIASGNNQNKEQNCKEIKTTINGHSGPYNLLSSYEYNSNVYMAYTTGNYNHIIEIWDIHHNCIYSTLPVSYEEQEQQQSHDNTK